MSGIGVFSFVSAVEVVLTAVIAWAAWNQMRTSRALRTLESQREAQDRADAGITGIPAHNWEDGWAVVDFTNIGRRPDAVNRIRIELRQEASEERSSGTLDMQLHEVAVAWEGNLGTSPVGRWAVKRAIEPGTSRAWVGLVRNDNYDGVKFAQAAKEATVVIRAEFHSGTCSVYEMPAANYEPSVVSTMADYSRTIVANRFGTTAFVTALSSRTREMAEKWAQIVAGRSTRIVPPRDLHALRPPASWILAVLVAPDDDLEPIFSWLQAQGVAASQRTIFAVLPGVNLGRAFKDWRAAGLPNPAIVEVSTWQDFHRAAGRFLNDRIYSDHMGVADDRVGETE